MTGSYPDVPAPRMAYDRDGTQVYLAGGGYTSIVSQLSVADMQNLNKENSSYSVRNQQFVFYFPEARDLRGYWVGSNLTGMVSTQVSTDSTNGIDGTWTTVPNSSGVTGSQVSMRRDIVSVTQNGIRAVRIRTGDNAGSGGNGIHLYGNISAGANPNRLSFWHPTLDQPLSDTPAFFDWGDRPRNTGATKTFRVKNRSATLTANPVTVGLEALTDATPAYLSQHDFTLDGSTYASTVNLGSIGPGVISPVVTVRQTLLTTSVLSLWWQRIYANAGAWS